MLFNSEVFLFLPVACWVFWLLRQAPALHLADRYRLCVLRRLKLEILLPHALLDAGQLLGRPIVSAAPMDPAPEEMDSRCPSHSRPAATRLFQVCRLHLAERFFAHVRCGTSVERSASEHHPADRNLVLYVPHDLLRGGQLPGAITPTADFREFASYVSLFSQLVAGPIVRFRQIEGDLENLGKAHRGALDSIGWSYYVIGLSQNLLIADFIAAIIDPALANYAQLGTVTTWACMLGYTCQLYFDFAGYSNMAVGLGYLFGIGIPQNFNTRYKADGIADFWRRWHISLSSCLREHIYIPLGLSRDGTAATYRNLLFTMLPGGLWHGATWTFVVWGAYHGVLLCLNRVFDDQWHRIWRPARLIVTFLLVVIGWVFFRSKDFTMAARLLGNMFAWAPSSAIVASETLSALLVLALAFAHFGRNTFEMNHEWGFGMRCVRVSLFAVCLLRIITSNGSPFLYLQF